METTTDEYETKTRENAAVVAVIQAGGHPDQVLIDSENPQRIIKKTKKTELHFYQSLAHRLEQHCLPDSLHTLQPWSGWRPQFFGTLDSHSSALSVHAEDEALIILENLTLGRPVRTTSKARSQTPELQFGTEGEAGNPVRFELYKHPNVIDIKLGQRLYDDRASPEKIARMKKAALETTTAQFGIRLTGAQLWNNHTREYTVIPKSFGKSVDPSGTDLNEKFNSLFPISDGTSDGKQREEEMKRFEGLTLRAGHLPSKLMKEIIDRSLIPKIKRIMNYVTLFKWRVYGSSLLIVFEAHLPTLDSTLSSHSAESGPGHSLIEDLSTVKMIDFAHVDLADSTDPGLMKGFQSVLKLFEELSCKLGSL